MTREKVFPKWTFGEGSSNPPWIRIKSTSSQDSYFAFLWSKYNLGMSWRTLHFLEGLGREKLVLLEKGAEISGSAGITCFGNYLMTDVLKKIIQIMAKIYFWHSILKIVGGHTKIICFTSSRLYPYGEKRGGKSVIWVLIWTQESVNCRKVGIDMDWRCLEF